MSVGNETFISDMRDALKASMEADPYFFDVPIITERLQNIEGKIEQLVAKAGGIAVVLVTPAIGGALANLKGANFSRILFVARVFENVKANPTGKDAQHVALYIAAFWSQLKPDTLSAPLKLDEDAVALGNDPRFLTYDVSATTEGGMQIEIPRLADLTIDASDLGAIVLEHPVAIATLVYTLDNSPAAPRNPSALPFDEPFNADSGVTLRARAWLPGYIPSAEKKVIL